MSSASKAAFDLNKVDIDQLWSIHGDYAGRGVGAKHGVEVINRSVVIFVTACWESYIEDFAKECFDVMIAKCPSFDDIPIKARNHATKSIFDQKDSREVWKLAGNGWRTVMTSHRDDVLERWLSTFNTPKAQQVIALYDELLGVPDVSKWWKWKNMTPKQAADKLDEFITIRGNIAHRVKDAKPVYKMAGYNYLAHIKRLIDCMEFEMYKHLKKITKAPPW
jgi:hypothetical protein